MEKTLESSYTVYNYLWKGQAYHIMKVPSLFIFDMDGLIYDTERVFMKFIGEVMAEHGYTLTEAQYIRTLGRSRSDCVAVMKEMFGQDYPSYELSGIARERLNTYALDHPMPEKPGIRELLRMIKVQRIHCCIASSSPKKTVEIYLKTSHLDSYFDFIMSGEQLTHSKPDPEVFLKCLEHYGIAAEDAVVLEDSEPGIQASINAGIPVICIPDMIQPAESLQQQCWCVAEDAGCVQEFIFGRSEGSCGGSGCGCGGH